MLSILLLFAIAVLPIAASFGNVWRAMELATNDAMTEMIATYQTQEHEAFLSRSGASDGSNPVQLVDKYTSQRTCNVDDNGMRIRSALESVSSTNHVCQWRVFNDG